MSDWTKETPTENGWHWFKFDPEEFPGLPEPVAAPKLLFIFRQPMSGAVIAQDPAEMFVEFLAKDMRGYWSAPVVAPPFPKSPAVAA